MIPIPRGVRVWIATGHTDMHRGMQGLALTVQESLKRDPHAGDLYIFRGRRGDGDETKWWNQVQIDPLPIAGKLWQKRSRADSEAGLASPD
jgi:transposase